MMKLIAIVILGSILGFIYGFYTDGFIFSTDICLFAGLALIMPSLFEFRMQDVQLIWTHKITLLKGLLVNYLLLPACAVGLGYATGNFGIMSGLFLLSVLSGGGMVMHWINRSKADNSFGFLLLFINLLGISLSLFMLHVFAGYAAPYFGISYEAEISISRFTTQVITLLIVIPFIASRVVLFVKPLLEFIKKYRKVISNVSLFIILFYLFGLQSTKDLIDVWDFEPELFAIAFGAVFVFYLLVFIFSMFIYDLESPYEKATFWHSVTRYITLALVISTFSMGTFGVSMLLPIMFAYLVQIPWAIYISKKVA